MGGSIMTSLFRFNVKEKLQKLELQAAKVANSANDSLKISNISRISNLQIIESDKESFEERAAIREFDGYQDRIKAENKAIIDLEEERFENLSEEEQSTLLDVFRTLLKWSQDLEKSKK